MSVIDPARSSLSSAQLLGADNSSRSTRRNNFPVGV
jgi:hypothetical protein